MPKYAVACRGDEYGADLEAFGPFDTQEAAMQFKTDTAAINCPNEHEVIVLWDIKRD